MVKNAVQNVKDTTKRKIKRAKKAKGVDSVDFDFKFLNEHFDRSN